MGSRSPVPEPGTKAKDIFYYTTACHIVSALSGINNPLLQMKPLKVQRD